MDVNIINDGIKTAREQLPRARTELADAQSPSGGALDPLKVERAIELLGLARNAIGEAAREFELADVPKVKEILDIERGIAEMEKETRHDAAVARGEDELRRARERLDDEDFDRALRGASTARGWFAKAHAAVPGLRWAAVDGETPAAGGDKSTGTRITGAALAAALAGGRAEFSRQELRGFEVSSSLSEYSYIEVGNQCFRPAAAEGSVEQEYLDRLLLFHLEADAAMERFSQVAAGDAALDAARSKLCGGDIEGAKEERATAVYAYQQAKADKRVELVWLNEQIVQAQRRAVVAEGDAAMALARGSLEKQDFAGARAARLAAVAAFGKSNESSKLEGARSFAAAIAEAEMRCYFAECDIIIQSAQDKVVGGDDIEGAKDERERAAGVLQEAERCAYVLLEFQREDIQQLLDRIAALQVEHAPCVELIDILRAKEIRLLTEIETVEHELYEGYEMQSSVAGREELAKLKARLAHAKKELDACRPALTKAQEEQEVHKVVNAAVRQELEVVEERKKQVEGGLAIRRKTLLDIDGDAAAARVLLYGTGLLDQTADVEMTQAEKEACAQAAQLFSEGLTQATSVGMRADLHFCRCSALVRIKRFEEALRDAEACSKLRPLSARSFDCKATALAGLERWVEAMDAKKLADSIRLLNHEPDNLAFQSDVRDYFGRVMISEFTEPQSDAPVRRNNFDLGGNQTLARQFLEHRSPSPTRLQGRQRVPRPTPKETDAVRQRSPPYEFFMLTKRDPSMVTRGE